MKMKVYCTVHEKGLKVCVSYHFSYADLSQNQKTKNLSTSQPTFNQRDWEKTGLL